LKPRSDGNLVLEARSDGVGGIGWKRLCEFGLRNDVGAELGAMSKSPRCSRSVCRVCCGARWGL
jgi:hypothetical protein